MRKPSTNQQINSRVEVGLDPFPSFPLMERTKDQARLTLLAHNEKTDGNLCKVL